MTVALALKKVLTPMAQPHQRLWAIPKPLQTVTPLKARTAASQANAAPVTAMAVTVASVVSAMAVANAAMQRPSPAPPKAKKARKWSTSCALLTLPSLLQRQHR